MRKPDAIECYSVVLLECGGKFLFLKRSPAKHFAPNLWTGVGGRVEDDEAGRLAASALRELREETGVEESMVRRFTLRRAVLAARPGSALTVLLYFTGQVEEPVLPGCPEGTLAWVEPGQAAGLEIVGTSRPVLPLVMADALRDPSGQEPLQIGVAVFHPQGQFFNVVWGMVAAGDLA